MDLSKFSDEELLAIAQGDAADKPRTVTDMSDDELYAIAGIQPLKHRESEPTREQKQGAYREMARGRRERLGPVGSVADTIGRGLARGVPFMDDIAAAGDYYLLGQGESYQDALDRQRAQNEVDDTDRPVASIGSQIAGAIALPAGAAGRAATLPGKIAAGAGVGAGYGAAYGAGQGDSLEDRADRAVTGGIVGGLAGAAAPPILAGVGAIGRAVTRPFRGIANPEAEAARRVQGALQRDAAAGAGQGLTEAELLAAREAGMPVIAGDLGGKATQGLARSAANTSPEARQALEGALSERAAGASGRAAEAVEAMGEGLTADAQRDALRAAARQQNRPAYDRANRDPKAQAIWDAELAQLAQAPAAQKAIRDTMRRGSNRAVAEGFDAPRNVFQMGRDGKVRLRASATGNNVKVALPNLQFWDQVHRNLADQASALARAGQRNAAMDVKAIERRILAKLDDLVPAFREARAGAAAHFGVEDAYELGLLAAKRKTMTDAELEAAMRKMVPAEKKLFKEGFVTGFASEIRGVATNRNIAQAIYGSDRARRRIQVALGPKDGKQFEALMHIEAVMAATNRAVSGNSTTTRQLIEAGLAGGGAQGAITGDWSPTNLSQGAIMGVALRQGGRLAVQKIDQRVARKVGEMLASNDPAKIRQLAQLAAHSPKHMDVLRLMGQASARLSGMAGAEQGGLRGQVGSMQPALADQQGEGDGEAQSDFGREMQRIRDRSGSLPRGTGPQGRTPPVLLGVRG